MFTLVFLPDFSHSAGGVVLSPKGDVLIVKQKDGTWSLPKGHLNEGEDPRDAAVREIIEETGLLNFTFVKTLGSYSRYTLTDGGTEDKSRLKRITMYLFIATDTDLHPADPRNPLAMWLPQGQVAGYLTHPKDHEFFESILHEL